MRFFGDTDDMPNEIRKLHREIDVLRNQSEFMPILTTGTSDDGFGASVGSKTMNSSGAWSLTPVKYKVIDNPITVGTSYDMLELISACAVIEDEGYWTSATPPVWVSSNATNLKIKTIRMASLSQEQIDNDSSISESDVKNITPNGAIVPKREFHLEYNLVLKSLSLIHI